MKGIDAIKAMTAGCTCVYDKKAYRFNGESKVESSLLTGGLGAGVIWARDEITRDMIVSDRWRIELNYNMDFMEAIAYIHSNSGNIPTPCIVSAETHKKVYFDKEAAELCIFEPKDRPMPPRPPRFKGEPMRVPPDIPPKRFACFKREEVTGKWAVTLLDYLL